MQQMLVDNCDLITRSKLSASSHLMKNVVASTKLFIPCVKLKELTDEGVLVKLTVKLFKDEYTVKFKKDNSGGTRIYQAFKKETVLPDTSPVKEAMNFFERMCLQKNITIGQLQIDVVGKNEELKKQFEELIQKKNIHLKIKYIYWYSPGPIDLFWKIMEVSDKIHLKELKVVGKTPEGGFNLFGEHDEILNKLEKIEVECDTNAKDENIRSLKASFFSLKSPHFTPELASHLIEKFTNERSKGSNFHIETSPNQDIGSSSIPRGFEIQKVFRNSM
ncbi:hypothetical protein CAEBREN_28109 [Caenorhabditis brenneri]|uniref:DUF38 domain-containing protein n=1 Tax=Caenorhabditis brenneri TaxID=135651 RepID=G0NWK4_CAEBE|nr:hypothetical protein CAEBREN_28109 [Caenorhabditis brenneri]